MKIAVTGRHGQLVSCLRGKCGPNDQLVCLARPEFDMLQHSHTRRDLRTLKPDILVNCAAYTAVDKAEETPLQNGFCHRINATAPGELATGCAELGIPIIQVSTDYVFGGDMNRPYLETDPVNPINFYGYSKMVGEQLVAHNNPQHVILRTSGLFSHHGQNFVKTMLEKGKLNKTVTVVNDQTFCPTSAMDLATAILCICHHLEKSRHPDMFGIFHAVGATSIDWAEFAKHIFEAARHRDFPVVSVTSVPSAEYPTTAKRPYNSAMNTDKLAKTYGVKLPSWRSSLCYTMDKLLS